SQATATVIPGSSLRKVFQVQLTNTGLFTATLTSLSFTNATSGPGSQSQKDAEWQTLELRDSRIQNEPDPIDELQGLGSASATIGGAVSTATFSGGVARFNCSVSLPAGQAVVLNVWAAPAVSARDGDALD